jgi:hypothetical protein
VHDLEVAARETHELPASVLPGANFRFIVWKEGMQHGEVWLSEIAFDKDHRHALVDYSWSCGRPGWKCGSGETLVYENVNGE